MSPTKSIVVVRVLGDKELESCEYAVLIDCNPNDNSPILAQIAVQIHNGARLDTRRLYDNKVVINTVSHYWRNAIAWQIMRGLAMITGRVN